MSTPDISIAATDNTELDAFLGDRLYEFNSETTGIRDGRSLWASVTDDAGEIIAGISGHTWGGTCEIVRLWVQASHRGEGLGTALMQAAEAEARRRRCHQIVLSTHSFQAPAFYAALGFERVATISEYPTGHAHIYLAKTIAE